MTQKKIENQGANKKDLEARYVVNDELRNHLKDHNNKLREEIEN